MVADSMLDPGDYLGAIYRNPEVSLAERHLGLQQASELVNLDQTLDLSAKAIQQTQLAELPPAVSFASSELEWYPPLLQGRSIAIACDDAFRFVYPANSDALREMGANLLMVSPIADSELPDCDALYLPGGYPELHAQKLAANTSFLAGVRKHAEQQKPILAECGGMLYLMQSLTDLDGHQHALSGVLPGTAKMQDKLAAIGMQYLDWPQTDQQVRGHTFHYSNSSVALEPIAHSQSYPYNKQGEAVYQQGNVTASYMHFYFASNPHLIAQLFGGGDAS